MDEASDARTLAVLASPGLRLRKCVLNRSSPVSRTAGSVSVAVTLDVAAAEAVATAAANGTYAAAAAALVTAVENGAGESHCTHFPHLSDPISPTCHTPSYF